MDQVLQPSVVEAHVKAMTHMQMILCEKEAATKIPWNTLSVSHAAHELCRVVDVKPQQFGSRMLSASQGCREVHYNTLSYAAYCIFAPATNLSRNGNSRSWRLSSSN